MNMKNIIKNSILLIIGIISGSIINLDAQNKVKVSDEEVKPICEYKPLKDRVRIAVARFDITTLGSKNSKATGNENYNTNWYYNQSNGQTNPEASMNELGQNMSTMLQSALQQTQCFNVLLKLEDKKDLDGEIEFGESESANKKTAVKKGNMQSAQVVITGEITEFNNQSSGTTIAMVKSTKQTVRLGFVITITNPETREVYDSRSFNVEGKSGGKLSIGLGIPTRFGNQRLDFSGGNKYTPAVANALEKGIIEASEWIAGRKDVMIVSEINSTSTAPGAESITITVRNSDYNKSKAFNAMLSGNTLVKNVEPNFDNGTSTITLDYTGTAAKLLDEIMVSSIGGQLNVVTQKSGEIELSFK